jgi:hypothetical protein
VPKPEQGRIILVEVSDPQGRNVKIRPAVIISETEQIQRDGRISCVAITSSLPDELSDDLVLLPYHPAGKVRSGLRKRSAAMYSWLFEIEEDRIEKYIGVIPFELLSEIVDRAEGRKP